MWDGEEGGRRKEGNEEWVEGGIRALPTGSIPACIDFFKLSRTLFLSCTVAPVLYGGGSVESSLFFVIPRYFFTFPMIYFIFLFFLFFLEQL